MSCPTDLGCTHDENRPPRFDNRLSGPCSGLNVLDLRQCPLHGTGQILVDIMKIFNDTDLVAVSAMGQPVRNKMINTEDSLT